MLQYLIKASLTISICVLIGILIFIPNFKIEFSKDKLPIFKVSFPDSSSKLIPRDFPLYSVFIYF